MDFLVSVVSVKGTVVSEGTLFVVSKGMLSVASGAVVSSVVSSGGFSCSAQYRL